MKTWQVRSQDTRKGLLKWAQGLDEAFVQLDPVPTREDGFTGQIRQVTTDQLTVSLVTSSGHEIQRHRRHIRTRSPDIAFVNILSRGRSRVTQSGSYEAAPMDVSVVDTRKPYAIRQDDPFQLVSIAVPTDWIAEAARALHPLGRSAAGRELSGVIWGLARMHLTIVPRQPELSETLAAQLRHALGLLVRMRRDPADRHATVDLLQSYILRHLDQPDLRAETLARHFGVSVRRVHQLFEPTGQSVSEFINDTRLEKAAILLSDADPRSTISNVAWQVGYADPSYFARRFKRRFGTAPRDYVSAARSDSIAQ